MIIYTIPFVEKGKIREESCIFIKYDDVKMKKYTFKEKMRYKFDNIMSKGSIALVGMLFSITVLVAILAAAFLLIVTERNQSFAENVWTSIMHIIDPGTITGAETKDRPFIFLMAAATICGIFVTSILIGIVNSGFESKLSSLRKGNSKVIEKNHTVILGFNKNIYTLISEIIIANENHKNSTILILSPEEKETVEMLVSENIKDYKTTKIICRTGNITEMTMLKNCALEESKQIIINEEDDYVTIKSLLCVNNYLKENCDEQQYPHIACAIYSAECAEIIKVISLNNIEAIHVGDSISRIIAQTCRQPGLSEVLIEFFDFDGDEIYFENFKELANKRFGDCLNAFEKAVVLGYKRDNKVYLNPDMGDVIKDDDDMIILVENDGVAKVKGGVDYNIDDIVVEAIEEDTPENVLIIGQNSLLRRIVLELDLFLPFASKLLLADLTIKDEFNALSTEMKNIKITNTEVDTSVRMELENLLDANDFKYIVLLSEDDMDPDLSDSRSLMKLIHLRDISQKSGKQYNITSEMKLVENQKLAKIAKANDLVVGSNIVNLMIAQVAENRHLADVFREILSEEGAEVYIRKAQNYISTDVEIDFYQLTEVMKFHGEIAIGYKKQNDESYKIIMNPVKSEKFILTRADSVITLAQ